MLLLVGTDGNKVRLIKKYIRRHKGGICEKSQIYVVGVLCGFILKLGHAGKLAELGIAGKQPRKLGMGGNLRLDKQGALLGVDAES